MKQNITKKYKALGFVESLIAISIAGIASVVLMSIAANNVTALIKTEIYGELTESAIEAGTMIKKIADSHNSTDNILFPNIEDSVGSCLALNGSTQDPSFLTNETEIVTACNYDGGDRASCTQYTSGLRSGLFRVFCILPDSSQSAGLVVGKVVVGQTDCEPNNNRGRCGVSDYTYYLVLKVKQK